MGNKGLEKYINIEKITEKQNSELGKRQKHNNQVKNLQDIWENKD